MATPPSTELVKRFPLLTAPSRAAVVAGIGAAIIAVLMYLVGETLATFVIGLILILVLDPFVTWLTARGLTRPLATIAGIGVLALVVFSFGYIVVAAMLRQGPAFLQAIGSSLASMQDWATTSSLPDPIKDGIATILVRRDQAAASIDIGAIVQGVIAPISGLLGPVVGMVLVLPFFMFYVLSDRPHLVEAFYGSVAPPWRPDVIHVVRISVGSFVTYVQAEALLMVALGTITFLGLILLGVLVDPRIADYALFLALIAAFSELIPTFGPYIALIPALIFTATLGVGPVLAVLLLYILIMFLEGNVLVPRIEGGKFALHPAFVIVLVLAGFALIGPLGAVLAMPVAAAGRDIFRYVFARASGMPQPLFDDQAPIIEPSKGRLTSTAAKAAVGKNR